MRRIILAVFFIVSVVLSSAAQSPTLEPGKPGDLKGVVRIYLTTDEERARQNIVAQIKQGLPQLLFVDRAEDAQVVLTFQEIRRRYRSAPGAPRGSVERRGSTVQTESRASTTLPTGEFEITALGSVVRPVGPTTSRRLLRFEDTLSSALEDKLSREFAGAFIKLYEKANKK